MNIQQPDQNTKYFTRPGFILLFVLVLAAALRFWDYYAFSLTNDELSALNRLNYSSFKDLVNKGFYVDGHPGGIHLMLYVIVKLFGNSAAVIRLPFVIFGILSVYVLYRLVRLWIGPRAALLTALSLSLLQFPLLYSRIARPYGSGLFFCLLAALVWTHFQLVLKSKDSRPGKLLLYSLLYALANALCMYNHYFSFLMALIMGITLFFMVPFRRSLWIILSGIVSSLLFLPHLKITLNHLSLGGVGQWLAKPGPDFLFEHIFYAFNDSWLMLCASLLIMLAGIAYMRKAKMNTAYIVIALLWFLLPLAIAYIYSYLVDSVLQNSVLIFSFPFLLILVFSFSENLTRKGFYLAFSIVLIIGLTDLFYCKAFYKEQHFGDFKGVAEYISAWEKEYGKDNIDKVININHPYYIEYYLGSTSDSNSFLQYDNNGREDMLALREILKESEMPFFLYARLKPGPDEVKEVIMDHFPYLLKEVDYKGFSYVALFGKEAIEIPIERKLMYESSLDFTAKNGSLLVMDTLAVYSPAIQISGDDIPDKGLMIVSSGVCFPEEGGEGVLVLDIRRDTNEHLLWKGSRLEDYVPRSSCHNVYIVVDINRLSLKPGDQIKIFVWNNKKSEFIVKNIQLNVYE